MVLFLGVLDDADAGSAADDDAAAAAAAEGRSLLWKKDRKGGEVEVEREKGPSGLGLPSK